MLGRHEHKPRIGSFAVFRLSDDGMSRVEGHKTYRTQSDAEYRAKQFIEENSDAHFTILKVVGTLWQHPKPDVLTDIERDAAEAAQ